MIKYFVLIHYTTAAGEEAAKAATEAAAATKLAATEAAPEAATETAVDSDLVPSWPLADFTPEEKHILRDAKLVSELRGVDNERPRAPDVPNRKTKSLEIQKFLSLLTLSYFPKNYRFALYPKPIGYRNYKAKKRGHDRVFGTFSGFTRYAYDMLSKHDRTPVIGFVMFPCHGCQKAVILKKKGDDYADGLELIFFDPQDDVFDKFNVEVTTQLNEVFGSHIKEAHWGGGDPYEATIYEDQMEWVCTYILDVVSDKLWRPKLTNWTDITGWFVPTHARPLVLLSRGENGQGGEGEQGREEGQEYEAEP